MTARGTKHIFRRAFTFIELSVVVVIIGILAALVGPRIMTGMGGGGIDSAARRLTIVVRHAADLAATTGAVHVLEVDLRESVFYITSPSDRNEEQPLPYEGRIHSLPSGVHFTHAKLEDQVVHDVLSVRFAPDGWADNAVLYLADERGERLSVALTRSMGLVEIGPGE